MKEVINAVPGRRSIPVAVRAFAASAVMAFGTFAHAAGEGSDVAEQIAAAALTVAAIGAAGLGVYVSIKVFKLVRAAL